MAQRGMLPKIRPVMSNGSARPSIRPVQPAPAPPRPIRARKVESGFAPKAPPMREPYGSYGEGATAVAEYEPPTQTKPRVHAVPMTFDDETQARPVDDGLLAQARGIDAPYESLPSLEVRRPYDSYEAAFAERDPAARRAGPHRQPAREEPSYPIPVEVGSGARERPMPPSPWDERREASGPQQRSWTPPPEPHIPPAPPVPRDARPATDPPFVMGVQALRTPAAAYTPVPYRAPQPQPSSRPHVAQMQQHQQMQMQQMQMQQMQQMQQRQLAQQPSSRPAVQTGPAMYRQQPQSLQADTTQAGSKASRFAWFVFGAAFGIAFAFCATGVPRLGVAAKSPEPLFPPAAALPTSAPAATVAAPSTAVTAPVATVAAPPVVVAAAPVQAQPVAAPVAPPVAAPVVVPPVAPVATVVAAPPIVAPTPAATMTVASPSALPPAPVVAAAPPPAPVRAAPRRTWSPPRRPVAEPSVPKPLFTGSTPEPAPTADVNDILAGALKP
jgi:hypothetical protein